MRETYQFRVVEEFAHLLFKPDEGTRLGDSILGPSIRKVELTAADPRFKEVGRLQRELVATQGRSFFHGWHIRRRYSQGELEAAELFELNGGNFDSAGEEGGTEYDESSACRFCGANAVQTGDLILDVRKAPRTADIATTIATNEWAVSQRLAEYLMDWNVTGFDLRPIRHNANYIDEPMPFERYPAGRELLSKAEAAGVPHPMGRFWSWLNRPQQEPLLEKLREQHVEAKRLRQIVRPRQLPVWHQLLVTSRPVPMVHPTRAGVGPFDDDPEGQYRCPVGHVVGLNLLSEVYVNRDDWDGSDFARTSNLVGIRSGWLRPRPVILISPRLWRLLRENGIKGWKVQVAHLV